MNHFIIKSAALALTLVSLPAVAAVEDKITPALLDAAAIAPQSVLLELREQADLSPAAALRDKPAKGEFVMQALRATAARSQAPVLAWLDARGLSYRSYWIANAIHLEARAEDLRALAALEAVSLIHAMPEPDFGPIAPLESEDEPAPRQVEPGLSLVGAEAVWNLGVLGAGVVVGDHDIGVDWEHPALKRQYRGWDGQTASHDYNWRNAFGAADIFCSDASVPCDPHGHGTHTTGTMVGDDGVRRIGMAPEAQWIGCRSLFDSVVGLGFLPTYMDCMEWFIAPYPQDAPEAADPAMAPDLINNSWGCVEGCPPGILEAVNEATHAAGIVQVVSAGNDGDTCSTIAFPLAIYDSSFTVGASNFEDQMAGFSSRGPVLSDLSMRLKPNVVAPGVGVVSSIPGGNYTSFSGTSMAGPHVAGLVALMISAEPALRGQVDLIRQIIQDTAVPIESSQTCGGTSAADIPNNIFGYGRIDALAAVLAIPAALGLEDQGDDADEAPAEGRGLSGSKGGALGGLMLVLLMLGGLRRR